MPSQTPTNQCKFQEEGSRQGSAKTSAHLVGRLLSCLLLLLFLVGLLLLVSFVYIALLVILLLLYIKKRNWM